MSIQIVNFVISTLFSKVYPTTQKPPHLLCHGFGRASATHHNAPPPSGDCGVPGLVVTFPNENIATLKSKCWEELHDLIGKNAEHIIPDVLAYCGVFMPVASPNGAIYQLSGTFSI